MSALKRWGQKEFKASIIYLVRLTENKTNGKLQGKHLLLSSLYFDGNSTTNIQVCCPLLSRSIFNYFERRKF